MAERGRQRGRGRHNTQQPFQQLPRYANTVHSAHSGRGVFGALAHVQYVTHAPVPLSAPTVNSHGALCATDHTNATKTQDTAPEKNANRTKGVQYRGNSRTDNPQQHRKPRRGQKKLDFKELNRLYESDPREIVMELSKDVNGFTNLIGEEKEASANNFLLILRVISRAISCTNAPQSVIHLLISVSECKFFTCLVPKHLSSMMVTISRGRFDSRCETELRQVVTILRTLLQKMPSKFVEVSPILSLAIDIINTLSETQVDIDGDIVKDVRTLEEDRDGYLKDVREGRIQQDKGENQFLTKAKKRPSESFRDIPVFPRFGDVVTDRKPFIRANLPKGSFEDVDDYLDVQFRLLREDFMAPLREGIGEILGNMGKPRSQQQRLSDVRVYYNVHILKPECAENEGICHEVSLDRKQLKHVQWKHTKRLIYGGLVCLTKDNFQTVMFATIANRDIDQLQMFRVTLKFSCIEDTLKVAPEDDFIMVETTAYFVANRYVLEGLQKLEEDSLPFTKHIVYCEDTVDKPSYLYAQEDHSPRYDFEPLLNEKWKMEETPERPIHRRVYRPLHLQRQEIARFPVDILDADDWPSAEQLHLNESQLKALKTSLTSEFAIIQGPPGTGKTHVGLKIMKMLLHNHQIWCDKCRGDPTDRYGNGDCSPILVVCYTNHALDQFLEGILKFLHSGIVRIGRRSKSEILEEFQLSRLRGKLEDRSHSRGIRGGLKSKEDIITERFGEIRSTDGNLIKKSMTPGHTKSLNENKMVAGRDIFEAVNIWLVAKIAELKLPERQIKNTYREDVARICHENKTVLFEDAANENSAQENESPEQAENTIEVEGEADYLNKSRMLDDDETDTRAQHIVYTKQYDHLNNLLQEVRTEQSKRIKADNRLRRANTSEQIKFQEQLLHDLLADTASMTTEEASAITDVWALNLQDRWKLYRHWHFELHKRNTESLLTTIEEYDRDAQRLKEARDTEDLKVLREAKVIGMTTTGAAKYGSLLHALRPRIIVVEEAAEVLEAHIITTLTSECQHLILIGDHQQLRPNPTVYKLARDYNLSMSLFERMIENNLQYDTLNIQHRMRPEIAELMKHIYKELHNHPSVEKYDDVMGVSSNIFFVNHEEQETFMDDIRSRSNKHEATFLVALCQYLLKQGYRPDQITILTMYTAQVIQLKNMMPRSVFEGVRISPVDNFQGEENDIILLSLVRSNQDGKIGFLSIENRVCVALSRAKVGFFCIGNFKLLGMKSQLWKNITADLKSGGKMGKSLKVFCRNHPDTILSCSRGEDFKASPEGGCTLRCDTRLECGHVCRLFCHPYDSNHEEYQCVKPCVRVCSGGHPCKLVCYKDCKKCLVRVTKTIERCGHTQQMYCYENPEKFPCPEPCEYSCERGHRCPLQCYLGCKPCKVKIEKIIPDCGHMQMVPCFQKPESFNCQEPCPESCEEGHPCPLKCYMGCRLCSVKVEKEMPSCGHLQMVPCHQDPRYYDCQAPCEEKCEKGHQCPLKCHEDCKKCRVKVEKEIPSCGHVQKMSCYKEPSHFLCKMPCPKMCERNHPCPKRCHESCPKCTVPVYKRIPVCYHEQKMQCHEDPSTFKCQDECRKQFECGHSCTKRCSDQCPPKCQVTVERTLSKCGHSQTMRCSEDESRFICKRPCEKRLGCNHVCPNKCGDRCEQQCKVMVLHEDWPCGHKVKGHCFLTAESCEQVCGIKLECGHTCAGKCGVCLKTGTHADCKLQCNRQLHCGHKCTKLCCEECSDICLATVRRTYKDCGHVLGMRCCENMLFCPNKCGAVLQCGHRCSGTCGTCNGRHNLCNEKCDRILLCGHPCLNKCYETCSICTIKHPYPCGHRTQGRRCNMQCTWRCVHHQCTRKCWEPCERPPCNYPCPLKLKCGHNCVGLCGEMCPRLCRACDRRKLEASAAFFGRKYSAQSSFIQLACGDVFEVRDLDRWMHGITSTTSARALVMKACPSCYTTITGCNRYNTVTKYVLATIEHMNIVPEKFAFESSSREHLKKLVLTTVPFHHQHLFEEAIRSASSLQELVPIENNIRSYGQLLSAKVWTERVISTLESCGNTRTKPSLDYEISEVAAEKARSLQSLNEERMVEVATCQYDSLHGEEKERHRSIMLQSCALVVIYRLQECHSFSQMSKEGRQVRSVHELALGVLTETPSLQTLSNTLSTFKHLYPNIVSKLANPPDLNPATIGNFRTFGKDEWYNCSNGHVFCHTVETGRQSTANHERHNRGPTCDQCPSIVEQTERRDFVWRIPEDIRLEAERTLPQQNNADWNQLSFRGYNTKTKVGRQGSIQPVPSSQGNKKRTINLTK